MSVEINNKTMSIYYAEIGPKDHIVGNWMGAINAEADGQFVMTCRFRFYRDDKTFNSADVKKWYTITGKNLDDMREKTHGFCDKLNEVGYWVLHRGDLTAEEMAHRMLMAPFAHTQHETGSIN